MFPNIDRKQEEYTLQSEVFGHRLKPDQTVYEYMIEFLQVMISDKSIQDKNNSIDIKFNEYFPINENVQIYQLKYHPISRVGLKRFIFFNRSKQDGKFPVDIGAYDRCKEILTENMEISSSYEFIDENYSFDMLEQLFYGFRSVIRNRSWFAQSALPICPELILPETMGDKKKRSNIKKYEDCCDEVDGLFETNRYNFMSRGGEVYYLHLLKALNSNSEYVKYIDNGFRNLINKFPQISLMANFISDRWEETSGCHSNNKITKTLGTIPDGFKEREKYTLIELKNFLNTNIHPFEKIDILSYGIILQIIRMMHEQACYITNKNRPFWVLDIREDNKSNSEIRKLAIKNYAQFEQDILDALHSNLKCKDGDDESKIMTSAIKDTYKLYRKLGKEIGIIIPIKGPGMRFTLSETMVKFLVLSIIKPKGKLTLDTFLDKLYEHYGIVIDSVHYEKEISKNENVYIDDLSMLYKNKMAFQQMLKDCGFLRDLSDSTSIVENPYDGGDMFE